MKEKIKEQNGTIDELEELNQNCRCLRRQKQSGGRREPNYVAGREHREDEERLAAGKQRVVDIREREQITDEGESGRVKRAK